eukprot:TRINITY_DN3678_c0_g1_i1.p1 TRINITY_DN3678_c0_g1~~TRINITY_DN3678_c0_g1_i1.p1  ORF type:complete len:391 (-),score=64.84 TRINITY_DN3678_c0_g1_i1:160-1332(-)
MKRVLECRRWFSATYYLQHCKYIPQSKALLTREANFSSASTTLHNVLISSIPFNRRFQGTQTTVKVDELERAEVDETNKSLQNLPQMRELSDPELAGFDVNNISNEPYERRQEFLRKIIPPDHPFVKVVPITKCINERHLARMLIDVVSGGGEGLVLRKPGSLYIPGRSGIMLKVKPRYVGVGIVTELETVEGTLTLRSSAGVLFKLFRRISKARFSKVVIGSIVEYTFSGLTIYAKPQFPNVVKQFEKVKMLEDVLFYCLSFGKPDAVLNTGLTCAGCHKTFEETEMRIQVKGIQFQESPKEPLYRVHSFCASSLSECVLAHSKRETTTIKIPDFHYQIGISQQTMLAINSSPSLMQQFFRFAKDMREQRIDVMYESPGVVVDDIFYYL